MCDGSRKNQPRRIVSLWFPHLPSDRVLRARPINGPFVLTLKENNANRVYCLNTEAQQQGLQRGMPFSDARAFCPDLQSSMADPVGDQRFLMILHRWAMRYCPWVGLEKPDGLVLNITGSTHLFGGKTAMLTDIRHRLTRAGIAVRIGCGATRGAAWALAHYAADDSADCDPQTALFSLPVAALRIDAQTDVALQRLGLHLIGDLAAAARAPLTRRFGPGLLLRLDQALGNHPEEITPLAEPPHYGVRITLPEPIGLCADVTAGTGRCCMELALPTICPYP